MATVTPGRATASDRPTSDPSRCTEWLRAVLDRPMTSYHLVLGATAILLALGLMMVLSASSVNAYVTFGDSYYYLKRQAQFLAIGSSAR